MIFSKLTYPERISQPPVAIGTMLVSTALHYWPRAALLSTQNRIAAGRVAALASTLAQTVIAGEIVDAATGPHIVVITGALATVPVLSGIKRRYCRVPALRVRH
jgi:hypothetical protein